jgi:4-amino-4-deoxy-L-arabinose transferase-like glycosyltransferase
LLWDTPRLLTLPYFWFAVALGSLPLGLWYGAQAFHYGALLGNNLVNQSFQRIWVDVESNQGPPWFYILEILKYGVPWVLFLPLGCRLAWWNRNLSWAKLAIVWAAVYLVAISLMATKLPWYGLPLYPALALLVGAQLAAFWRGGHHDGVPQFVGKRYSPVWMGWFVGIALAAGAGVAYYLQLGGEVDLLFVLGTFGLTMVVATVLMARQNPQFVSVLLWGTYLSLMLLGASDNWVWELAEHYPVKPVAAMIQRFVPEGQPVYTSYPDVRPSLNFYSDRPVLPVNPKQLEQRWEKNPGAFFLLNQAAMEQLKLKNSRVLGKAEGWMVVTRAAKS